MVLEGRLHNDNVAPCLLYLHCDPHGSEEITGLGIVSEARNMEVYVGDEYCGTGRGAKVFTGQHDRSVVVSFFLQVADMLVLCGTLKGKNYMHSTSQKTFLSNHLEAAPMQHKASVLISYKRINFKIAFF